MSDSRLANHQQFDALRCRLCNKIYDRPKLLGCLHSFCCACLEEYETERGDISANQIQCPLCKEVTDLPPVGGVRALTDNTLIKRYVTQAHRDKTQIVAGREVLELQRQALTEEELSCPDIVSSIQHIADTAGEVIASGIQEQSQVHDFDTVKIRHDLQTRTVHLQEKALDIIHAIDQVNAEVSNWTDNKNQMRDRIKMRSAEIQETIQNIERQLLANIDDRDLETEFKDECFSVKTKLHQTLKSDLNTVEFMKLLAEFGDADDLKKFIPIVNDKEKSLLSDTVDIKIKSFLFEHPTVDIKEGLEMMFGGLTRCSEEKSAWDPAVSHADISSKHRLSRAHTQSSTSDSSPASDIESHSSKMMLHHDTHTGDESHSSTTNYTEIDENNHHQYDENEDPNYGSRFSKRFDRSAQKVRRRPMKSMSFDAGLLSSPYMTLKHGHHIAMRENEETGTQEQYENDDTVNEYGHNNNHNNNTENETNNSKDRYNSALNSLDPIAERKSWNRRVSAPSSIVINSLNQRRLSALSILERANIKTEGLNLSSDVESGLNEARLEWLRENFHRRAENGGKQLTPSQEPV